MIVFLTFFIFFVVYLIAGVVQWKLLKNYFDNSWTMLISNLISLGGGFLIIIGISAVYAQLDQPELFESSVLIATYCAFAFGLTFGLVHSIFYCFFKRKQAK